MKRYFALVLVVLLAAAGWARADGPDDLYLEIYNLIQEGDSLYGNAQPAQARAKYLQAQTALRAFQKGYPAWNTGVVNFRLDYLTGRITEATAKTPATATPQPARAQTNAPSLSPAANAQAPGASSQPSVQVVKPVPPADWQEQIDGLKNQVSRLQADKDQLQAERTQWQTERNQLQTDKGLVEAKLKESLSTQPPAVDPADLARAQQQIKSLEAENDSLRTTLEKNKPALEKQAQQAKTKPSKADEKAAAALRSENQLLKKQLADLKASSPAKGKAEESARQLAQAQAQIATLQSDKEMLALEKSALQNRVSQLSAAPAPAVPAVSPTEKTAPQQSVAIIAPPATARPASSDTRQLECERDALQKQLEAANKELNSRKSKAVAARVRGLENELEALRTRLEVYEARQVPYTAEELELFKRPAPSLAARESQPDQKSVRKLSPGAANLVIEARRYFSSGQYDKAEDNYLQALREDQKDVPVLANLAAIQIERNHLAAAETNITQAVALNPGDAYSLTVLGNLRFRQGKYDEALDALSRAAKLDPKNAEIQNYLGLTFSEKGMRGPAETALRKAIQLDPGYASAHNNLAVVYITARPPAVELARWHYQKALAAGHPRNMDLEKMLDAQAH